MAEEEQYDQFSEQDQDTGGFESLPVEQQELEATDPRVTQQQVTGTTPEAVRALEAPEIQRAGLAPNPANTQPGKRSKPAVSPEEAKKQAAEIEELFKQRKWGAALIKLRRPEVRRALADRVDELIKEAMKEQAVDMVKDQVKKRAKIAAMQLARSALVTTAPVWAPVVGVIALIILIIAVIVFVIFLVIALRQPADNPPGSMVEYGVGSADNPLGIYLREGLMVPELTIMEKGQKRILGFEATVGKTVVANPVTFKTATTARGVTKPGWWWSDEQYKALKMPKSPLAMSDLLISNHGIDADDQDQMDFYVSMRWLYKWGMRFDGGGGLIATKYPLGNYARSVSSYAGKKILIYNPETKKAAVAIIAEWGPSPKESSRSLNSSSVGWNERPIVQAAASLRAGRSVSTFGLDPSPPDTFNGPVIEPTPKLLEAIGAKHGNILVFGWVGNDPRVSSARAGTVIEITDTDIVTAQANIPINASGSGIDASLPVPGVIQGEGGDCPIASQLMVGLYYMSNKGTSGRPAFNTLPENTRNMWIKKDKSGTNWWYSTTPDSCLPNIDSVALDFPQVPRTFRTVTLNTFGSDKGRRDKVFMAIINSLSNGHPVVVYGRRGAPYGDTSGSGDQHVFVITGYNKTSGEFYFNNPTTGKMSGFQTTPSNARGTALFTNRANLKWPRLYRYLGGQSEDGLRGVNNIGTVDPEKESDRRILILNTLCITSATCSK